MARFTASYARVLNFAQFALAFLVLFNPGVGRSEDRSVVNTFDKDAPVAALPILELKEATAASMASLADRSAISGSPADTRPATKSPSRFGNLFAAAPRSARPAEANSSNEKQNVSAERRRVYDFLMRDDVRELMVKQNFVPDDLFSALEILPEDEVRGFALRVDRMLAADALKNKQAEAQSKPENRPSPFIDPTDAVSRIAETKLTTDEKSTVVLATVPARPNADKQISSPTLAALPSSLAPSTTLGTIDADSKSDSVAPFIANSPAVAKTQERDSLEPTRDASLSALNSSLTDIPMNPGRPGPLAVAPAARTSTASPEPLKVAALGNQEVPTPRSQAATGAEAAEPLKFPLPERKPAKGTASTSKSEKSQPAMPLAGAQQVAQAGGGLFGAPSPQSGGLFGTPPSAATGGGLFSAPTPAASQNTGTITLNESLRNAIDTNPKIRIALAQTTAVQSNRLGVFSGFLPQIDSSTAAGYQSIENNSTRQDGRGNYETSRRRENSLTLTQPIFSGFETVRAIDKLDAKIDVTKWRALQLTNELAIDVVTAHTDVLKFQEATEVIQEQKKFHQRILDSVQRRATGGAGSSSDVAVVSARIARLETTLVRNIEDTLSAASVYERLVGERPRDLKKPERVREAALPRTIDEALDRAVKGSPNLRGEESEIAAATAEVDIPRSRYLPRVGLELEGSRDSFADAERGDKDSFKAMVRVRWNLYRGGADRAAELEALSRVQEARGRKDLSLIELKEQVRKIFSRLEQAKSRVSALTESVSFSKRARENIAQQFEVGQKSLIEVLDAANEEFNSEIDLVSSEYGLIVIQHQLLWITGDILSQMDTTVEDATKSKIQENLDRLELRSKGRPEK